MKTACPRPTLVAAVIGGLLMIAPAGPARAQEANTDAPTKPAAKAPARTAKKAATPKAKGRAGR